MIEAGVFGLMWSWATGVELARGQAIGVVVAIAAGALAFQPLIGVAIDRLPPRPLLLIAAGSCLLGPLAAGQLTDAPLLLYAVMLIWGGVALGLYSVSLATLGGRYSAQELATANAALVVAYGVGALVGPVAAGAAMSMVGPHGLLWTAGAGAVLYLSLLIWRTGARGA